MLWRVRARKVGTSSYIEQQNEEVTRCSNIRHLSVNAKRQRLKFKMGGAEFSEDFKCQKADYGYRWSYEREFRGICRENDVVLHAMLMLMLKQHQGYVASQGLCNCISVPGHCILCWDQPGCAKTQCTPRSWPLKQGYTHGDLIKLLRDHANSWYGSV